MSAAVRFEDHVGPVGPGGAGAPARSAHNTSHPHEHAARLRALAHQMRHCVVTAIGAHEAAVKVELWAAYRSARAEALALLESTAVTPDPRRLHSV